MAEIRCEASDCGSTNKGGKIFFQCNGCGRWWCSKHGSEGKKCPGCGRGFLKR